MSGLSLNRLLRNNRRLVRAKQCCERACSKAEDIKSHARTKRQFEAVECVSETRYPITLRSEPRTKWILNCANVVLGSRTFSGPLWRSPRIAGACVPLNAPPQFMADPVEKLSRSSPYNTLTTGIMC
ncbi:hypothetical protein HZH68_007169 [Vespula germanica]|uniref:Uncharacterized protein n=1 Tax=Vespula germanica TaxID=30212 RepID=A0A834K6G0_VESGE|nr:hypothetical protein HZH68_007169 [Vespula germanica]